MRAAQQQPDEGRDQNQEGGSKGHHRRPMQPVAPLEVGECPRVEWRWRERWGRWGRQILIPLCCLEGRRDRLCGVVCHWRLLSDQANCSIVYHNRSRLLSRSGPSSLTPIITRFRERVRPISLLLWSRLAGEMRLARLASVAA